MDEYTVGNCEIEISNCPKIIVNALKLRSHQKTIDIDTGNGIIEHRPWGPVEWEVTFNIIEGEINLKQEWFKQFNSNSQIGTHLGREKLIVHVTPEYKLNLIGYLMLPAIHSSIGYTVFEFKFNGTLGEDINLVPDPYSHDHLIGSPYSDKELEGPTTEELAEDFEFMTKKIIATAKTVDLKFKKRVSFKKSDEIIVIQRKITF